MRAALVIAILLIIPAAQAADCVFQSDSLSCPDKELMRWSGTYGDETDAHAAVLTYTSFDGIICCQNLDVGAMPSFYLSSDEGDAHISISPLTWPSPETISTNARAACYRAPGCGADVCVAEVSDPTNGHVAECGAGSFGNMLCCPAQPEDCTNNIDDDDDGFIDCQDVDCYSQALSINEVCTGSTSVDYSEDNPLINTHCGDQWDGTPVPQYCCPVTEYWNGTGCQDRLEICNDGIDNNEDGLIDCGDDDCYQAGGYDPLDLPTFDCTGNGQDMATCSANLSCSGRWCSPDESGAPPNVCCGQGFNAAFNATSGLWECESFFGPELCFDGWDNDGDSLIDCQDDNCSLFDPGDPSGEYCYVGGDGTFQDSTYCYNNPSDCTYPGPFPPTPGAYYCSRGEYDNSSTGLCCPESTYAFQDPIFGTWRCEPTDACYNPVDPWDNDFTCHYEYNNPLSSWINDTKTDGNAAEWCVDPPNGLACCLVVEFMEEDYYSDTGNVIIY